MNPSLAFCGTARDRIIPCPIAARNDRTAAATQGNARYRPRCFSVRRYSGCFVSIGDLFFAAATVILGAMLSSCHPAEKTAGEPDPYLIRIEFVERKLDELRETTERRFQDERVRRENQLAVQDRTLREMQQQLIQLETKISELSNRLALMETSRVNRAEVEVLPPLPASPSVAAAPPLPPAISVQPAQPAEKGFPLVITDITSFVVRVRTQATVRVVGTGKTVRDEAGRRVPEVKTETHPIYEYEYRLRFTVSNRTPDSVSFQAEAGYGPLVFNLASGESLRGKEIQWKPGASLLIRTENQYRLFPVPPPPPP